MADANMLALRAAARVMARYLRIAAAKYTREGAANVNIDERRVTVAVRAGRPGGPWGWEPIQAWMLDNNGRHELYGSDRHWYAENRRRGNVRGIITGPAVDAGADPATAAFADVYVAEKFG